MEDELENAVEEILRTLPQSHYPILLSAGDQPSLQPRLETAAASLGESACGVPELATLAVYANAVAQVEQIVESETSPSLHSAAQVLRSSMPRLQDYVTFMESFSSTAQTEDATRRSVLEYAYLALVCIAALENDAVGTADAFERLVGLLSGDSYHAAGLGMLFFLGTTRVPQCLVQRDNPCALIDPLLPPLREGILLLNSPDSTWLTRGSHQFVACMLDAYADQIELWDRDTLADPFGLPSVAWLDLFAYTARLLAYSSEFDTSGQAPSDCDKRSAQYVSWRLGQYVGRFASSPNWQHPPHANPQTLLNLVDSVASLYPQHTPDALSQAVFTALSLLMEFHPSSLSSTMHESISVIFRQMNAYADRHLESVSPNTDLFWAMRLGFLEASRSTEPEQHAPPDPLLTQINQKMDIMLNRSVRLDDRLERRLGSTKDEIDRRICDSCPEVEFFDSQVIEYLRDAEKNIEQGRSSDAREDYAKAVEAALDERLIAPLCAFMQEKLLDKIQMPCPIQEEPRKYTCEQLDRWALSRWANVFRALSDQLASRGPSHMSQPFRQFLRDVYRWEKLPDLSSLATMLNHVQQLRGGSAHAAGPTSRLERSREACHELRSMTLGLQEEESVLSAISRLLRPRSS